MARLDEDIAWAEAAQVNDPATATHRVVSLVISDEEMRERLAKLLEYMRQELAVLLLANSDHECIYELLLAVRNMKASLERETDKQEIYGYHPFADLESLMREMLQRQAELLQAMAPEYDLSPMSLGEFIRGKGKKATPQTVSVLYECLMQEDLQPISKAGKQAQWQWRMSDLEVCWDNVNELVG